MICDMAHHDTRHTDPLSPTPAPRQAGTREWAGAAVIVLSALLISMDLSVLYIALPWIAADMAPTGTQELWIMDVYGFVLAGLMFTMGNLGDRYGRRRLLIIGSLLFGAASLVAALSTTPEMLIVARVLLGVGGAALGPSTLSLLRPMFPDENQRRTAVGAWTAGFAGGPAVGPIIGGLLLEHFHWGSVFLINLPVMAVLLISAPLLLRESRDPAPGPFDPVSAILPLTAVVPVIYGIKKLVAAAGSGSDNGSPVLYVGAVVVGVAFGSWFVRRQLATDTPMLDIRLFGRVTFSASLIAALTVVFAVAGMGLMTVQFLQTVLGYSPFQAALWMLPTVAGTLAGVTAVSALARRLRPGVLVPLGLLFVAAGFLWVTTIDSGSSVGMLIGSYTLITFGVGLATPVVTSLVLTTAPPEKAGAASALTETGNEFGGALGIAALGTVSTAVYTDRMKDGVDGVTGADASTAADTVIGAVSVAGRSSPDVSSELLTAAFDAYARGFGLAATVGGALAAVVAVFAAVALRRVPAGTESEEGAENTGNS